MPDETFDYQQIDNFIHSRIRLAIMAVLASVNEMDFNSIKKAVNTTDGNLSVHLKKLEEKLEKAPGQGLMPRMKFAISFAGSSQLIWPSFFCSMGT